MVHEDIGENESSTTSLGRKSSDTLPDYEEIGLAPSHEEDIHAGGGSENENARVLDDKASAAPATLVKRKKKKSSKNSSKKSNAKDKGKQKKKKDIEIEAGVEQLTGTQQPEVQGYGAGEASSPPPPPPPTAPPPPPLPRVGATAGTVSFAMNAPAPVNLARQYLPRKAIAKEGGNINNKGGAASYSDVGYVDEKSLSGALSGMVSLMISQRRLSLREGEYDSGSDSSDWASDGSL